MRRQRLVMADGRSRADGGRLATATAAMVAAILVTGCLPEAGTVQAREVESLYGWFLVVAAVVGAFVWIPLTWAVVRYRRRERMTLEQERGSEDEPPQTRGHFGLELAWTAGPAVTIAALFAVTLLALGRVEARPGAPSVEVEVEAYRWGWTFSYPGEGVTVVGQGVPGPELVLPVGEPVAFTLTSADVIHSFYVPRFLMKRDATPGRPQRFDLTIEAAGTYAGQCAEYCGILHDQMPLTVRAVAPDEYRTWLETQRSDEP